MVLGCLLHSELARLFVLMGHPIQGEYLAITHGKPEPGLSDHSIA